MQKTCFNCDYSDCDGWCSLLHKTVQDNSVCNSFEIEAHLRQFIEQIDTELLNSNSTEYICNNGHTIHTDVGYIQDWWDEYKKIWE